MQTANSSNASNQVKQQVPISYWTHDYNYNDNCTTTTTDTTYIKKWHFRHNEPEKTLLLLPISQCLIIVHCKLCVDLPIQCVHPKAQTMKAVPCEMQRYYKMETKPAVLPAEHVF